MLQSRLQALKSLSKSRRWLGQRRSQAEKQKGNQEREGEKEQRKKVVTQIRGKKQVTKFYKDENLLIFRVVRMKSEVTN